MHSELDPVALRWYRRPQIDEAARAIREQADAGLLGQLDLALELSALIFRDSGGSYWFLDAWAATWYRFDGHEWVHAQGEPPRILEGLYSLAAPPGPIDPPPEEDATPSGAGASPIEALAAAHRALCDAYRRGWIASADAEMLLGRGVLIDRDGLVWTVGADSGAWYRDQGTGWSRAPAPPDPASLARIRPPAGPCPSCGAALEGALACLACGTPVPPTVEGLSEGAYSRAVRSLLARAGALPEPLAAPWTPPPAYPDLELPRVARRVARRVSLATTETASATRCPACGAELRPGVRFCGQCGTALGARS